MSQFFNVEDYIEDCIDSILNQDYPNFELIIVNDGSTDSSSILLEKYKTNKKIKIIYQENQGLSCARNTGLKLAKNNYIWFIDSDDFIAENSLSKLAFELNKNQLDVLGFAYKTYKENIYSEQYPLQEFQEVITGKAYIENSSFFLTMVCGYVYSSRIIKENGIEFKKNLVHEDDYFNFQIFQKVEKIKNIPDCIYYYRLRENSITSGKSLINIQKRINAYIELIKLLDSLNYLEKVFLNKKKNAYFRNIIFLLGELIHHNNVNNQNIFWIKKTRKVQKKYKLIYPITTKREKMNEIIFMLSSKLYLNLIKR